MCRSLTAQQGLQCMCNIHLWGRCDRYQAAGSPHYTTANIEDRSTSSERHTCPYGCQTSTMKIDTGFETVAETPSTSACSKSTSVMHALLACLKRDAACCLPSCNPRLAGQHTKKHLRQQLQCCLVLCLLHCLKDVHKASVVQALLPAIYTSTHTSSTVSA